MVRGLIALSFVGAVYMAFMFGLYFTLELPFAQLIGESLLVGVTPVVILAAIGYGIYDARH